MSVYPGILRLLSACRPFHSGEQQCGSRYKGLSLSHYLPPASSQSEKREDISLKHLSVGTVYLSWALRAGLETKDKQREKESSRPSLKASKKKINRLQPGKEENEGLRH